MSTNRNSQIEAVICLLFKYPHLEPAEAMGLRAIYAEIEKLKAGLSKEIGLRKREGETTSPKEQPANIEAYNEKLESLLKYAQKYENGTIQDEYGAKNFIRNLIGSATQPYYYDELARRGIIKKDDKGNYVRAIDLLDYCFEIYTNSGQEFFEDAKELIRWYFGFPHARNRITINGPNPLDRQIEQIINDAKSSALSFLFICFTDYRLLESFNEARKEVEKAGKAVEASEMPQEQKEYIRKVAQSDLLNLRPVGFEFFLTPSLEFKVGRYKDLKLDDLKRELKDYSGCIFDDDEVVDIVFSLAMAYKHSGLLFSETGNQMLNHVIGSGRLLDGNEKNLPPILLNDKPELIQLREFGTKRQSFLLFTQLEAKMREKREKQIDATLRSS